MLSRSRSGAAHYCAMHGPVLDAVRHAAAAGDAELSSAARRRRSGLMSGGHQRELRAGLRSLPDDVIAAHPPPRCDGVVAPRSGEFEIVNRLAEQAIRAAPACVAIWRDLRRHVRTDAGTPTSPWWPMQRSCARGKCVSAGRTRGTRCTTLAPSWVARIGAPRRASMASCRQCRRRARSPTPLAAGAGPHGVAVA
jgi:hypothetical protein